MGERQDAPADRAETPPGFRPIPLPTPGDPLKFPWSIEVALSGGGLRATAFGLGVLLYLADAGLNGKVRGIASVSGGSITNGFVACRGDYGRTGKDEFRVLAAGLARKIAFEGIWSSRFVWLYVLALLVVGLVTSAIYLLVSEERSYALTGAAAADERGGSRLLAPMPGLVTLVQASVGMTVNAGDTLVQMEAMKMVHTISAPAAGRVSELRCRTGDAVRGGDVLVVMDIEDN